VTTIVATANLQAHMPLVKVAGSVLKLRNGAHPDLVCFQEVGGVRKWATIRAALGHHYTGHRDGGEAAEVPIAWRRHRYKVERLGDWHLSDPTNVGARGAGPRVLRGKKAPFVVLDDARRVHPTIVVNAHLAPSPWLNKDRSNLHHEQVSRLAELADFFDQHYPKADLFFCGDWNTTDRWRLMPLVQAGLNLGKDVPTHGKHALDRIASTLPHKGMWTIPNDSDHDALIGRF